MGVVATIRTPTMVDGDATLSAGRPVSLTWAGMAGGVPGGATSSGLPVRGVEGCRVVGLLV